MPERAVAAFSDKSCALESFQSGLGPDYETETALVALVDDLCLNVDKSHAFLLLLLDLSAAFDTADHAILLKHLEAGTGIRRHALVWFKLFLMDQT